MKILAISFLITAAVLMAGCVPSINPFYSDCDVYFDANLLGEWVDDEGTESWVFEHGGENDYRLVHTDENKKTGVFVAKLFKLGDQSFLDIAPLRSASGQNDFYLGHMLPLHTFVKITINGGSGTVAYMDHAWLDRQLEKNPNAIRHAVWSDNDIFLTDSTKNLQAFIRANLNAPDAFVGSTEFKRKPYRK